MNKQLFHFLGIFFAFVLTFGFASCNSCQEKKAQGPQPTQFEKSMTNQDSVEVTREVSSFFDQVKGGNIDDAISMLYRPNKENPDDAPQPLDNEEIKKIRVVLNTFPVVRYHIDYIKFNESDKNEVKVTLVAAEAHDDMPEVKTVFYFNPVKYLNTWKLCVIDSHNGDRPVILDTKRDSMQKEYKKEMDAKKAVKK